MKNRVYLSNPGDHNVIDARDTEKSVKSGKNDPHQKTSIQVVTTESVRSIRQSTLKQEAFLNPPVARQGRYPVLLLTVRDCPAKAGPPEYSGMQTITDRPIRGSNGYSGNNAKTALPLGIPAFIRSNVLVRIRTRTEGFKRNEWNSVRWSVRYAGDSVQPPLLDSERRSQETGKPAIWIGSCSTGPAEGCGCRLHYAQPRPSPLPVY